MRAVVLGLLSTALAFGTAQAGNCPISRQNYSVTLAHEGEQGKVSRPDLIDAQVKGVRQAGAARWNAIEVKRGDEHFVVRVDFTPKTVPATMGFSWSGSAGEGINWSSARNLNLLDQFEIYDGPLKGLVLERSNCD